MPDKYFQIEGDDDCVYLYDYARKKWQRRCDINNVTDIPAQVRKKIIDEQERARQILEINIQEDRNGNV